MPSFSQSSRTKLATCHVDLQRLLTEAIKYVDFSVTCGHRNKEDQDKAVMGGLSKTPWPTSKHNSLPSMAVDIAPAPCDWNDEESFTLLAGKIEGIADMMNIKIRLGADWDGDGNIKEHGFCDRPHIELIGG